MSAVSRISRCRHLIAAFTAAAMLCCTLPAGRAHGQATVELITFGPGDDIWSRFGHVGILVAGPAWGEDLVFSYGYAPFGEPGFVWGYLRGTSRFQLVIERWEDVLERYGEMDRTIERQRLLLSPARRDELVGRLIVNARPENREYVYDHLYDNCSTRVRDLLDDVTGGAVSRATWQRSSAGTFRELTLRAASGRPDALILLDLLSGPNQETAVTGWAEMYLPAGLRDVVAAAEIEENGRRRLLAGPVEVVYARRGDPPQRGSPYLGRWLVLLWCLLLSVGLFLGRLLRKPPSSRLLRLAAWTVRWQWRLTVLPICILGMALFVFALISEVRELQWNENMLLFWPTDFVLLAVSGRWRRDGVPWMNRWLRVYLEAHLVVVAALVALKLGEVLKQDNWAFVIGTALLLTACVLLPSRDRLELAQDEEDYQSDDREEEPEHAPQSGVLPLARGDFVADVGECEVDDEER